MKLLTSVSFYLRIYRWRNWDSMLLLSHWYSYFSCHFVPQPVLVFYRLGCNPETIAIIGCIGWKIIFNLLKCRDFKQVGQRNHNRYQTDFTQPLGFYFDKLVSSLKGTYYTYIQMRFIESHIGKLIWTLKHHKMDFN